MSYGPGRAAGLSHAFSADDFAQVGGKLPHRLAGAAGNAAAGGVIGGAGAFTSKPRGGVDGGGPSGRRTSSFSQMNHAAAAKKLYSNATRHGITKVLRKLPYAGYALAAYELYDAFCD